METLHPNCIQQLAHACSGSYIGGTSCFIIPVRRRPLNKAHVNSRSSGTRWPVASRAACIALALVLGSHDTPAQTSAQAYPAKPIRVIDAYPPGGSTDVVARIIAVRFQESTGQPWVIDNRPGAQGIIGSDVVARAAPDGYNLLMFTGSHTIHLCIYPNMQIGRASFRYGVYLVLFCRFVGFR